MTTLGFPGFFHRLLLAVLFFAAPLFAFAHDSGTTGGLLTADEQGKTITLTLSRDALIAAQFSDWTPELSAPHITEQVGKMLFLRVGEKRIPVSVSLREPDTSYPGSYAELTWVLPAGTRSFSIERIDPDGGKGFCVWEFEQKGVDGFSQQQGLFGDRLVFPVKQPETAGTGAPAGEPEETPVHTNTLRITSLLLLGFSHIVPEGLDHILFIVSLFLLAPRLKPLLWQATAFTLAHSITLGLAMSGVLIAPSRTVETFIALSIVVMALGNLKHTDKVKPHRWLLVFVFGLVHGLGFAGSFARLKLSSGDLARTLFFLNLGIELAQISILLALFVIAYRIRQKDWYFARIAMPCSLVIAAVAAYWTVQRAFF